MLAKALYKRKSCYKTHTNVLVNTKSNSIRHFPKKPPRLAGYPGPKRFALIYKRKSCYKTRGGKETMRDKRIRKCPRLGLHTRTTCYKDEGEKNKTPTDTRLAEKCPRLALNTRMPCWKMRGKEKKMRDRRAKKCPRLGLQGGGPAG